MTEIAFTPERFAGRTIIVTGAGSGIGRATAVRLGHEVVVLSRRPGRIREILRLDGDLRSGATMGPLFGVPIVILSPLAFLSRPARWLWAVHAHRATVSAAPNFAFDLCLRKVTDEEIAERMVVAAEVGESIKAFSKDAHPMGILESGFGQLSTLYPEAKAFREMPKVFATAMSVTSLASLPARTQAAEIRRRIS